MVIKIFNSENKNLLIFNIIKVLSLSSLGPFQIYSLLYLSSSETGRVELGSIMIFSILLGILVGPKLGTFIDTHERKLLLNFNLFLWIFISITGFIVWNSYAHLSGVVIPALFLIIDFTEGLFFSTLRSIQQTIIGHKKYGMSNSISEISGQIPAVIGATLAIPVLSLLGPRFSLVIQAPLITFSIILLRYLKENFSPVKSNKESFKENVSSLKYIKENFSIIFFFYLLNFTFIVTTIGNFLKPIFIVNVLHGNASGISLSEITYSTLGMSTGAMLSFLRTKFNLKHSYIFMLIFAAGCFLIPSSTSFAMYIGFQTTHGVGNPGNRISRNTVIMNMVPKEYSGRFNTGVQILSDITRLLLLLIFTISIEFLGPTLLLTITGVIMLVAIILSLALYRFNHNVSNFFKNLN